MTLPPTTYQTTSQVRMSGNTVHKYMQICMVQQPDVCHMQNVGYTRVRTYITESNLEICTSIPSTQIQFIRGRQFHSINLQTTKTYRTWHPLQRGYEYCSCILMREYKRSSDSQNKQHGNAFRLVQ